MVATGAALIFTGATVGVAVAPQLIAGTLGILGIINVHIIMCDA